MPLHIERTRYAPTIMGPFAYLKNMQCNHAIINLESQTHDYLKYQNQIYDIQVSFIKKRIGATLSKKIYGYNQTAVYKKKQFYFCHVQQFH
ncbi:MAG: hypothetical protein ACLUIS_05900 [Longibaculum sp.]